MDKILKIGDKVTMFYSGKISGIYTVTRVTKTMAFCNNDDIKLRRAFKNKWISEVSPGAWSRKTFVPYEEDHGYKLKISKAISTLSNVNWSIINDDALLKIAEILETSNKKTTTS